MTLSVAVLMTACALGQSAAQPALLAADQRIRIGAVADVQTLDPAQLSDPLSAYIVQNVFGGLYRLDDHLNEIADIATGPPTVSPDGTSYTFQLKTNARFSNGDPVSAEDVVYSWNRVASLQGPYAGTMSPISGYDQVEQGKASAMSGLTAAGPHTVAVRLTSPTGWFPTVVAMSWAAIVDRKTIEALGQQDWWKTPVGLIGSGPFRMTSRTPGQSLSFAPVPNYWRDYTGALSEVSVGIEPNEDSAVARYASGAYDILLSSAVPSSAFTDARVRKDARYMPDGKTDFVGFNLQSGPFAGLAGGFKGRLAFSLAIDREALSRAVCGESRTCRPATGGLIPEGLRGYLGSDPNSRFDPKLARTLYHEWDPDGSKLKGLEYHFESFPPFRAAAENLRAQWKANLGVDVTIAAADPQTYQEAKNRGAYAMFREGWGADYNYPQNWYQLFRSDLPFDHFGYLNPRYDSLVRKADAQSLPDSMAAYKQAGQLLIADAAYAGLLYADRLELTKPYVQGSGGNALSEYSWTEVRRLRAA